MQGYKGQNKAFRSLIFGQQGILIQNSQREQSQGMELDKAARMMCFQGKCIPCRLTEQTIPLLSSQEIYKGLTVAPHGDGFFLNGSRIQRNRSLEYARCLLLYTSLLSLISCHNMKTLHQQKNFSNKLPTHTTTLAFFLLLGCI